MVFKPVDQTNELFYFMQNVTAWQRSTLREYVFAEKHTWSLSPCLSSKGRLKYRGRSGQSLRNISLKKLFMASLLWTLLVSLFLRPAVLM